MSLLERKLSKDELAKREEIILNMKKNKRDLVKKYGKDAEAVMYGRATNMAKQQTETMNRTRIREMVKQALSTNNTSGVKESKTLNIMNKAQLKETIQRFQEGSYPFDECLSDNEGKYGVEGAKKVCGAIRAAYGEGLVKENNLKTENTMKKPINEEILTAAAGILGLISAAGGLAAVQIKMEDKETRAKHPKLAAFLDILGELGSAASKAKAGGIAEEKEEAEEGDIEKIEASLEKVFETKSERVQERINTLIPEVEKGYFKKKFGIGKKKDK